ncbi:hypothetical protein J1N35_031984 [Gossypium stocksii]|uniref:Uncharacterized protein n=1 Tax=Gossypium stocksii TaxID=47602 RepID=A0A9D3ZVQ1_9ROSI|nr:hypothetical protein J1N35_031984 [Gossypium stocksii]
MECGAPPSPTTTNTNNHFSKLLNFHILYRHAIKLGINCATISMAFHLPSLQYIILVYISPIISSLKHNLKRNKTILGNNLKASILTIFNPKLTGVHSSTL